MQIKRSPSSMQPAHSRTSAAPESSTARNGGPTKRPRRALAAERPAAADPVNLPGIHEIGVYNHEHVQGESPETAESEESMEEAGEMDEGSPRVPDVFGSLPPVKKKRRRQALSCLECKRRKIKCDRKNPCDQCEKRGEPNCEWHILEPADKPVARSSYNSLKTQLDLAREAYAQLQAAYKAQQRLRPSTQPDSPRPPSHPPLAPHSDRLSPNSPHGLSNPYAVPLDPVEHLQAHIEWSGLPPRRDVAPSPAAFRRSPSSDVQGERGRSGDVMNPGDALMQGFASLGGFPAFPGLERNKCGYSAKKRPSEIYTGVPPKADCDVLVDFFFTKVHWHIQMLHEPSFAHVYNVFWSLPTPAARCAHVKGEWMALFWMVLCLGLTNMGHVEPVERRICADGNDWRSMGMRFWAMSHRSLSEANFLSSKAIEVVQTFVLFSYCNFSLNNQGYMSQAPLTALAIRIAMNQGLHRLGREPDEGVPARGLVAREIGRRVWWNVIFLDWNISTQLNSTYLIHPSQCNTAEPLNLDWEEMVDGKPLIRKPTCQRTGASMLLAKIALAHTVRELSDFENSPDGVTPHYLLVNEVHQSRVIDMMPPSMSRYNANLEASKPVVQWERLQVLLHLNNRGIRMHRKFMLLGYGDLQYRRSTEVCISAAQAILVTFEEARCSHFPGCSAWYNLMYCWIAAVILTMDRFYSQRGITVNAPPTTMSRVDLIRNAVGALESIGDINDLARRGAYVLRFLLQESEKWASPVPQAAPEDSYVTGSSPSGREPSPPTQVAQAWAANFVSHIPPLQPVDNGLVMPELDPSALQFWDNMLDMEFAPIQADPMFFIPQGYPLPLGGDMHMNGAVHWMGPGMSGATAM